MSSNYYNDEDTCSLLPWRPLADYQHWSPDSENAGSPVLEDVLADAEEYRRMNVHEESELKRLRTGEEPVLEEDTDATKGGEATPVEQLTGKPQESENDTTAQPRTTTRTLEQALCELRHWKTVAYERWTRKIMSLPHWKHTIAGVVINDFIDDAVDFSDRRSKLLCETTDVDLEYKCEDNCLELTVRGNFHDRPLLLEVCTCCQINTTADVRLLLMRLARRWNIKQFNFPGIYFTTIEGNTMRELR